MKRLLKIPNARWYLGGQTFSLFGDVALWLAMGIWVKELTGSAGQAGLTFFFFGLATLLAPLAGLVVDRLRRRPVLIWANLCGALVVLGLLFVHGRGQVWLIWLIAFLYGTVYSFLSAAQSGLLVSMLDGDLLVDANGFLQTVREGLRLFGPLTGAGLFAAFGGGTVAIMDSATFLIAAGALGFVHVEEERPVPVEQHRWAEVTAGVRHLWRHLVLRQAVIAAAVACLVIGFLESIGFAVVGQGLHRPPTFLGVVIATQGVGAVVGGVMSARSVRRLGEGPVVGIGLLMLAVGSVFFMMADLPAVFAGAIVLGASLPLIIVGLMTLLQRRTPNELQGRVSSAADTLITVPQTLSIAVGAILISQVNYRYLLAAIAAVVSLAGAYLLTRREQWRHDRAGEGGSEATTAELERGPLALAAEAEHFLPDEGAATFETLRAATAAQKTTETR
ncbi:MAG: MFS transporter [Acidimicrobiales bacterium]|jgi:MFS family permease